MRQPMSFIQPGTALYGPLDGAIARFPAVDRIDTPTELEDFMNGPVLATDPGRLLWGLPGDRLSLRL